MDEKDMKTTQNNESELNEQVANRLAKLNEMEDAGCKPFNITKAEQDTHSETIKDDFENFDGKKVAVAGRLLAKRGMGKVSFCDLSDREGTIQLFSKQDVLGDKAYEEWQKLDIGDLIAVKGEVFKTKRGEISIRTEEFQLLAKALRPLPEKFHGLRDTDTRYRKRYLDLIVNQDVRDSFIKRSKIIKSIRDTLNQRDFLEVETPLLNLIPGGAEARPFITHHNTLDLDLYLRISPELYLKRLLVGGFERVFEIGRNFRNEGMSVKHNPEFTMVELYQAFTDYHGMMEICRTIFQNACDAIQDTRKVEFNGHEINLDGEWQIISMTDAVKKYAGVDFDQIADDEAAFDAAKEAGLDEFLKPDMKKGDILNLFFEEKCEEKLIQPTFLIDYPVEISPLTKRSPEKPELTERFELFIGGTEFANAYSELNDPRDQKARFEAQQAKRLGGDEEANIPDEDYVEALEYGLPPCGGLGIGIDRMVMLLTENSSIRDVLLFPTMKPVGQQAAELRSLSAENEASGEELAPIDLSKVKVEPLFGDMVDFETFSKNDFRAVKVLACEEVPKSKKLLKFTLDDGSGEERTILSGIKKYYDADQLVGKTLLAITNLPPRKMMGIDSEGMILSTIFENDGEEALNLVMLNPRIPAGAKVY